ncbi:hypothetical protein AtEden1_Chr5g0116411 [Arabidopsis thaliana]
MTKEQRLELRSRLTVFDGVGFLWFSLRFKTFASWTWALWSNCKIGVLQVITTVSTVSRFPYCCREGETDYEARYVTFTIRDNL